MTFARLLLPLAIAALPGRAEAPSAPSFDPRADLLSLHYDHAPDKDDGQSAAADRTLLESLYGRGWLQAHVVAVSGAYGLNRAGFNAGSDEVMDAAFRDVGGWLSAHRDRDGTVEALADRWRVVIRSNGRVWVKEGGQSDLTAAVVRVLRDAEPDLPTRDRIQVIQHSGWNEEQTSPEALAYTRAWTHYVRIPDANAYLNLSGGDREFEMAATAHPVFGPIWQTAFAYYDPDERLDFSDTGELLYLLGLGELSIDAFRERFLATDDGDDTKASPADPRRHPLTRPPAN